MPFSFCPRSLREFVILTLIEERIAGQAEVAYSLLLVPFLLFNR